MKYNNYDITKIYYSGYTVTTAYSCGGDVVFETEKKPKLIYSKVSDPTKKYQIDCNGSGIVTQAEVDECYSALTGCCTQMVVGDCVTHIGYGTSNMTQFYTNCLQKVILPDSLRYIGYSSFASCTSLESINIPTGVTVIRSTTFSNTALKTIDLHSGITEIQTSAFYNCILLESIYVRATTPPLMYNAAFENTNNCPIYVPYNSVYAYKQARGWSAYSSRIQPIPT